MPRVGAVTNTALSFSLIFFSFAMDFGQKEYCGDACGNTKQLRNRQQVNGLDSGIRSCCSASHQGCDSIGK
jgi:hypothetical protein